VGHSTICPDEFFDWGRVGLVRSVGALVGVVIVGVLAGCAAGTGSPQPQPTGPGTTETTMTARKAELRAAGIARAFDHGAEVGTMRARLHRVNRGDDVHQCGPTGRVRIVYRYTLLPPVPERKVPDILSQTASIYEQTGYRVVTSTSLRVVAVRRADECRVRVLAGPATRRIRISSPCVWPHGRAPRAQPSTEPPTPSSSN